MEAWFYFTISPKKYIWLKKNNKNKVGINNDDFILPGESREISYAIQNKDYKTNNNRSRLKSLANSLDMETDF